MWGKGCRYETPGVTSSILFFSVNISKSFLVSFMLCCDPNVRLNLLLMGGCEDDEDDDVDVGE